MQKDRSFWSEWARKLNQWALAEMTAALLEGAGPVNLILAQMIYGGRPLLGLMFSSQSMNDQLTAFAGMMEDQEEARSFAAYLREESRGELD